jgi:AcrR family transcriptional regulator
MRHSNTRISLRKQPKQARSTRLVEDVLQAAIQVLAREGVRRFTSARVAEAAGVSVGSLYQYFPNKKSILFRLQLDEWRETAALLTDILDASNRTPFERLRTAIAAFLRSECEEAPIRTALADAAPLFRDAPEAAIYRRAAFRPFLAFWRELLPEVAPKQRRQAVEIVMMAVEAVGKRVSEDRRSFADIDAYAQALADMVCAYLGQLREACTWLLVQHRLRGKRRRVRREAWQRRKPDSEELT